MKIFKLNQGSICVKINSKKSNNDVSKQFGERKIINSVHHWFHAIAQKPLVYNHKPMKRVENNSAKALVNRLT